MAESSRCPDCGADLPTGATHGLCPKCLMQAGFDSHDEACPDAASPFAATTPQPAGFTPPRPEVLAPYFQQLEIVELLGHGGMGAVYKARQRKLDRLVALKIIRPESADDPAFAERFNREARTLARLSHPQIVAVHDFGEVGSACRAEPGGPAIPREERRARQAGPTLYYFVMEYVDGPNLRQMLQAGDLQPAAALAIVSQICAALQYAHDEGVVHRDIKPENILLDRKGRAKIADFGLAKLSLSSPEDFTLTATHQVMGTPRYMAPEQMAGSHAVDHRADIYSLGVVFYEMLTGEVPMGHFAPPSKKSPAVDARLDEVVLRALAREPERRYQQASDLETDLEAIASRDSESRATLSAGATPVSRPGMSSLLEQNVAAAAGWFGGRTALGTGSTAGVNTAAAARRCRGPGLALMLYGLLLLLPAAFLALNGYDIADGNDATPRGVGVGLILAGLGLVGVCGLLLRGGWHMLTLEKYQPALLASFVGQPIGLWGLLVLGRADVKAAFEKGTPERRIESCEPQSAAEISAPRQILRGLGWLLLCVNLTALAISFAVAETHDISFTLTAPPESAAGKIEYEIKKLVWHGIVPYVVSVYVFIPLASIALSVGVYLFVRSYLQARYGRLLDPLHADEVRRDLRGPSTGLIVTGLANWIGIPLAVVALSSWVSVPSRPDDRVTAPYAPLEPVLVWLALLAFVAAGVMTAAGILMKRLRAWRFAMVASVLAMFISPGNLIGLPIGIWSLVVLSQPGVREAFRRQRERRSSIPDRDVSSGDVAGCPGANWASAHRLVQNPANGLFIAGMCYWFTIPLAFVLWTAGAFGEAVPLPHAAWWFFMMQPALAGTILMFGGLRMKRLEGYSAAIAAAIAPLVVLAMNLMTVAWMDGFGFGPGDLIGPPMGLWALAVLSRVDVRATFSRPA